ncbi:hypothetical protein H920_10738 [Fukomys damarensis]|uniref:Uncharacterized protein n=1 Tax=Fukomys damarensis TaxID=885580 RepID=A0A091D9U8_FUKDA|nr:hypothetical protein H920_10738 [Fukomys damarensis]
MRQLLPSLLKHRGPKQSSANTSPVAVLASSAPGKPPAARRRTQDVSASSVTPESGSPHPSPLTHRQRVQPSHFSCQTSRCPKCPEAGTAVSDDPWKLKEDFALAVAIFRHRSIPNDST